MKRISLWSGPRNVSTALMYSFAQRSDTKVLDEPLYAYYLNRTGLPHPGREEVLQSQSIYLDEVLDNIFSVKGAEVLFIKNMAHHLFETPYGFLEKLTNMFLIRHPAEMLTSLIKQIPNPDLRDTAYAFQLELARCLEKQGHDYVIIDSKELLLNPEKMLKKVCGHLDLPFESAMLSWEIGPRKEDGVWAKYWYNNVHLSEGFQPFRVKNEQLPEHLMPLLKECTTYYDKLYQRALKAD